jgi:hypothetical protein
MYYFLVLSLDLPVAAGKCCELFLSVSAICNPLTKRMDFITISTAAWGTCFSRNVRQITLRWVNHAIDIIFSPFYHWEEITLSKGVCVNALKTLVSPLHGAEYFSLE